MAADLAVDVLRDGCCRGHRITGAGDTATVIRAGQRMRVCPVCWWEMSVEEARVRAVVCDEVQRGHAAAS